jgi:anti-sigma28 factor (negative regulator of flagellin synthesis)
MEIYGTSQIHGTHAINAPQRVKPTESNATLDATPLDTVDISAEADLASRINDIPDIRADRVADIRGEIAAGAYETDEKLDVAVGRLLDEIG